MNVSVMSCLEASSGELFATESAVVIAYLFGSQARGDAGPLSDVDVAVLIREEASPREQLSIRLQLMEAIIGRIEGVSMISAHNAEVGLTMAEEQFPSLVLMDINLPGMDGVAAMKVLSANEKTKDIPVIAISAAAMKSDISRGMNAGFKAYLTKPFNVPEIVETIKKELGV